MKLRLLIVFFLLHMSSYAQNHYELLYIDNKYDEIIDIAEQKISKDSASVNDFFWYAYIANKTHKTNKALEILKKGNLIYPQNTKLEHLLASIYFENGDYLHAKPILQKHLEHPEMGMKCVKIYEFNKEYTDAIIVLKSLYKKDSLNFIALKRLGENYEKTDSIEKAIYCYDAVLAANPMDQPTAMKLFRLLIKDEKYDSAIAVCKSIIEEDSLNATFHKFCGFGHYKNNSFPQAIHYLSKANHLGDSGSFVYKHLGISEIHIKNFHTGREHLLRAYKKDPIDVEICFFLGKAYLNSTQKKEALFYLNIADSLLQPPPALLVTIYKEKASVYAELQQFNNQLECLKKAYQLNPTTEDLYYMALLHLRRLENKEKALDLFQQALKELPDETAPEFSHNEQQTILMMRISCEGNIKAIKEELFFEGKLSE